MNSNTLILVAALLAITSILASLLSRRIGTPILLIFLVLGMLAGKDGLLGIEFYDFDTAFFLGSVALAVIIFDGGLGARRDTFRAFLSPAISLATVGVIVTASVTGVGAHWILNVSWQQAFIIGAIVASTDAAAVFGLLKFAGLRLKDRALATLEIESGTNDPMAIFLTIALVQWLVNDNSGSWLSIVSLFILQMGLGGLLGYVGGRAIDSLLNKTTLPASLNPLFTLAGGLAVFALTNLLGGSGFLAIYIAGVWLGNHALPGGKDIYRFHDGMAWMSQITMFLMLGLLVTPSQLPAIMLPALGLAFVLIFVARPLAVFISLAPFRFPWREQAFIGWCGLRGAVPIILALYPSLAGLPDTDIYLELVFFVVIVSLVVQGWSITPMAKWLNMETLTTTAKVPKLALAINTDRQIQVYQAVANCRALGMKTKDLPISSDGQIVSVIRLGVALKGFLNADIMQDDQVVFLMGHETDTTLASYFAPETAGSLKLSSDFFGVFGVSANAQLNDIAMAYGATIPDPWQHKTVAEAFAEKYHPAPVVGDTLTLGKIELVIKSMDAEAITQVGLKFEH